MTEIAIKSFAYAERPFYFLQINSCSSGGKGPCHISSHRSRSGVLVANYEEGTVAFIPVAIDGYLLGPSSVCKHTTGFEPNLHWIFCFNFSSLLHMRASQALLHITVPEPIGISSDDTIHNAHQSHNQYRDHHLHRRHARHGATRRRPPPWHLL